MSELGKALQLMHGARDRFGTVRVTVVVTHDGGRARRAHERYAASPEGRNSGFVEALAEGERCSPRTLEKVVRLWVETPNRIREERETARGLEVRVQDGERWWISDPEDGLVSNEGELRVQTDIGGYTQHLLDPSTLLGAVEFEYAGTTTVAGRAAVRLRGKRAPGRDLSLVRARLGLGADTYDFVVDAERGVLLRTGALIDGKEYSVTEVFEIAFDESFPAGTFQLGVPPGEAVRTMRDEPRPREVSLDEAARDTTFTVWAPSGVSSSWRRSVNYFAGDTRYPAVLDIEYWLEDGTHGFSIFEMPTGVPDPFQERLDESIERNGEQLRVTRPRERNGMTATVQLERDATKIVLTSTTVGLEDLLTVVDALAAVPAER